MDPLKTIIVDDEWLIRVELKALLKQYTKIDIVGEASNISDAVQLICDLKPDVIFLDNHMTDDSVFEALRNTCGSFKTVFLSAFEEKNNNDEIIDVLFKPISKKKLRDVIVKL